MSFENPTATKEALDARWYRRFEETVFDDYEKLAGNGVYRKEEQRRFLNGEVDNPTLDYPELERFNDEETERALLALKADVLEQEPNETIRKVYRAKLNESIATVRMLRAAKHGDDRRFARYASFIYGVPQPEHVSYVVDAVRERATQKREEGDDEQRAAAERLLALLSSYETQDQDGFVGKDVLPEGEDKGETVTDVDEVVHAFEAALAELELEGWNVVVDTERGIRNFSVSQETKTVNVPSAEVLEQRKLSERKLRGLIAHELGTHALRRQNGERSKLQLLGLGLDRYLKGEEGVATFNEQHITGASEFAGIPRYFSIAVAKGLGGAPRDFRQTFAVMRDYRLLSKKETPERAAAVDDEAWNDCVRIFRGSTGTTPGAIYTKDLAYMGNRDVWTLVSRDSDAVETFSIGKFDPTNDRHVAILSELGILDNELDDLDAD